MPESENWERIARDGDLYFEGLRFDSVHWSVIRVEKDDTYFLITPLRGQYGETWLEISRVDDGVPE